MDNKCQPIDPDVNSPKCGLTKNGLILRPVVENESGIGLPYAPQDWPKPGDIWGWKVGNRINFSGWWQDRYLYLPTHLQKPMEKRRFASRPSVKEYIQKEFPDADIKAFFSSFSWRIPATKHAAAEGATKHAAAEGATKHAAAEGETTMSGINCVEKTTEHSRSELKAETVECKAGNWMCRLQLQARNYSLPTMACDICCSETGFCRDCCCILCCKIVDWAYGAYSFIRCEEKVNESYICGHVAHVDCALRSYMAGTVGGNSGLDVEYYCRRCDKKSDLIIHVARILQTCDSLDSRDDIEKILNIGLCILGGSKQERSKRLLHRIELILAKLDRGSCLEDARNLGDKNAAISAGDVTHSGSNGALYGTTELTNKKRDCVSRRKVDNMQQIQRPITSNHQIESSKLEEKVGRALRHLRNSQENEYKIAQERLCAQKDFILDLYRQLETERSELAKRTSSATDCNVDTPVANIMNKVNQIKREVRKLKDMEEVAKGFGRVPKVLLKEHFGVQIAE